LISNLYLHYVLDLWIEKKVKPKLDGEVYYFRYLDDFMLCFEDAVSARRFEQVLPKRLEKFGLLLEPSKTRLIRFGRFALRDCARAKQKPQTLYFLGMRLYCSATKQGRFKVGFLTERTRLNRFLNKLKEQMRKWRHLPLRDQCQLINRRLVGHFNYYAIVSNYPAIKRVYYQVLLYWPKSPLREIRSVGSVGGVRVQALASTRRSFAQSRSPPRQLFLLLIAVLMPMSSICETHEDWQIPPYLTTYPLFAHFLRIALAPARSHFRR